MITRVLPRSVGEAAWFQLACDTAVDGSRCAETFNAGGSVVTGVKGVVVREIAARDGWSTTSDPVPYRLETQDHCPAHRGQRGPRRSR